MAGPRCVGIRECRSEMDMILLECTPNRERQYESLASKAQRLVKEPYEGRMYLNKNEYIRLVLKQ